MPNARRTGWAQSALLDRAIQDLVRRFVGPSALLLSSACGEPDPLEPYADDLPAEGSGFDALHCTLEGGWDPMPFVAPAETHDYQALKSGSDGAPAATLSEEGEPCAGASDPAMCQSALSTTPNGVELGACVQICDRRWVITRDGDVITPWKTSAELLAFLGEIDAPEDALLVVHSQGYGLGHGTAAETRCETAAVREVDAGYEVYATRLTATCAPVIVTRYLLHVSRDGVVTVRHSAPASREDGACIGRRPEGLLVAERSATGDCELGAYLAHNAHLEGAAVYAFERMIDELRVHGAPEALIAKAAAARSDEVRHAALVGALAERHGARVPEVRVAPSAPRGLLEMALENAVEGCVRETWGAVVGSYQAARAADRAVADLMGTLAEDERRHATLSFELAEWLDGRLDDTERGTVATAYAAAIAELRAEPCPTPHPALQRSLGLPDATTAAALFAALEAELLA